MIRKNRVLTYLAVVTVSATLTQLAFGTEKEETVLWSQVPVAAQQTIKQYASEKAIQKIEKDDEDGKISYEFQVVQEGKKSEITVATNGKLLSMEEVIALTDVPAVVRQTLEMQASGGKMGVVEKVTENGKTTFETKVEKNGKKLEIIVLPDGKIAGSEDVTKEKE